MDKVNMCQIQKQIDNSKEDGSYQFHFGNISFKFCYK